MGEWLLSLPLVAPVRDLYAEKLKMYDTAMLGYLAETRLIDDVDRERIKADCEWWVRQTNARQAWLDVIDRYRDAVYYVAIWPLLPVAATVIMVLSVATPPAGWAIAHIALGALFTLGGLSGALRHLDFMLSRRTWLLGLAFLLVSGLLLYGPWTDAGWLAVTGTLLLVSVLGLVVAFVALAALEIRRIRTRAAIYLIIVGAVAMGALAVDRGTGPGWARGLWAGLWTALVVMLVAGAVFILTYLISSVFQRRKNSVWAIGEIVQTLLWFGLRMEEAHLPLEERSALGQAYPFGDPVVTASHLESLARVVERYLPRQLPTWDPMGDRIISERCRGMAARLRELKMEFLLNQRIPPAEMAARLVPAVVPIVDGDWERLARADIQVIPHSRLRVSLRIVGGILVAIAPLTIYLLLRTTTSIIPDKIVDQVLPVAVTWLLLSVIAWIDPGNGNRTGNLKNLTDLLPGSRS
ncbi:hypothetical protein [Acrocarpospora macrocephala]|uniref:hypothetical protein n=1 Tax=Acrocarpospora macrocephala TaxID=150177 RepID=UPI0012D2D0F7|nr:hypothetical protein [Acrocarpospora macrocephala]